MEINFLGYVAMTKYCLPHLIQTRGNILVISSISGVVGITQRAGYCASKFAVNGFFQSITADYGDKVHVTTACPSSIAGTGFRAS